MTPEALATYIIAIAGPMSGILIAAIANHRSKKQWAKENQVAITQANVSEKDAHTREIAMILDGYTKVNQALNTSLERALDTSQECSDKYDALEARFDEERELNKHRQREMIDHIMRLEALVPSPPGPPDRPEWSTTEGK